MDLKQRLSNSLAALKNEGTFKYAHYLDAPMSVHSHILGNGDVTVLSSNNYLGLANHPNVVHAAKNALDKYGAGTSSVRFICGTFSVHKDLETALATFHKTEGVLTYSSCWSANTGLFASIVELGDVVLSDELNHASIIDALRLIPKGASKEVFRHSDMEHLEKLLQKHQSAENRIIVTDGVFSMEGDIARLDKIVCLAEKYDAIIVVDDSHGVGVMGENGRGVAEYYGVEGKIDIFTGTLGKALGGAAGGYVAGNQNLIDLLFQKSRPQIFSNAISPATAATALAALKLVSSKRVAKLHQNITYLRKLLKEEGLVALEGESAIVPIVVGKTAKAIELSQKMLEAGFFVTGFGFPVVPEGEARLRLQVCSEMEQQDIEAVVRVLRVLLRQ